MWKKLYFTILRHENKLLSCTYSYFLSLFFFFFLKTNDSFITNLHMDKFSLGQEKKCSVLEYVL